MNVVPAKPLQRRIRRQLLAEFVAGNNADFALCRKAFRVFAFAGFTAETNYTALFCLYFNKKQKPSNPYGSRTFADGVKWTRTIDPHDVNVIL